MNAVEVAHPAINVVVTATGKHRAVCEFCGRMSRAHNVGEHGRLSIWQVGAGWLCAPFPVDFVHSDGSTGTMWECPSCYRRMHRLGEGLTPRREPRS